MPLPDSLGWMESVDAKLARACEHVKSPEQGCRRLWVPKLSDSDVCCQMELRYVSDDVVRKFTRFFVSRP